MLAYLFPKSKNICFVDDLQYDNLSTNMSLPVYFGMCQLDLALFYREECNANLTALVLVPAA